MYFKLLDEPGKPLVVHPQASGLFLLLKTCHATCLACLDETNVHINSANSDGATEKISGRKTETSLLTLGASLPVSQRICAYSHHAFYCVPLACLRV